MRLELELGEKKKKEQEALALAKKQEQEARMIEEAVAAEALANQQVGGNLRFNPMKCFLLIINDL